MSNSDDPKQSITEKLLKVLRVISVTVSAAQYTALAETLLNYESLSCKLSILTTIYFKLYDRQQGLKCMKSNSSS